jgi:hypothetical protein
VGVARAAVRRNFRLPYPEPLPPDLGPGFEQFARGLKSRAEQGASPRAS